MKKYLFIFLLALITRGLFAEDFKTIDGKEYKNVTVSRVEPDGIMLTSSSGIFKVYFSELPKEVQERFHYDATKATAYSAQQVAADAALQKQQQEGQRKREESVVRNNAYVAEAEAAHNRGMGIKELQERYAALQQEEQNLSAQLGQAEAAHDVARSVRYHTRNRYYSDSREADIRPLTDRLEELRHEKDDVKHQIEQAQRQK